MDKRIFGNRYQVTERIGMGGMAEVFRATDNTLGRTVAVKVMLPQYASDPTFAARFKQEAQAAANLSSPYIVNIYDWGRDDDMYYIVMEYVRGTDLKTAIQQRGSIHPRKVAEIGSQVCSALSIAHSYGIIHRDIKSANIMVQTDGNVKVMDFGIAQAGNSDMTQDSSVLGTAHYVSPEQAQGKHLTGASDLYSLGVVMYEAATGQLPFEGNDAVSVALKQVNEEPVPPRAINSAIDPTLEAIILKALSKNVATRWANANEMRQALEDYLAGRKVATGAAAGAGAAAGGVDRTRAMTAVGGNNNGSKRSGAVENTYDQDEYDEKPKGNKTGKILIAVILLLVLVFCVVGAVSCSGLLAEKIIVPNVVGMTEDEARATIEDYGFSVGSIKYKISDTVEKGVVISQDPESNDSAPEGSKVNLVVSSGTESAQTVTVPDLSGCTASEAENLLAAAGLTGSAQEGYSDTVAEGKVFEQSPAKGTTVQKGSTITYSISKGKRMATVTDVTGWDASSAQSELSSNGFNVTTNYQTTTDQSQDGLVYRMSISGGSQVAYGSSITIYVYKYEAPEPEPTPTPDPDPDPTEGGDSSGSGSGSSSSTNS